MAEFTHRYARAFAAVASDQKLDVPAAQNQLRDFAQALKESRQLREVLSDPSIPRDQKLNVLDAIGSRLEISKTVRNFLAVIIDHGRIGDLDEILTEYAALADETSGVAEAEITSALPLDAQERATLETEAVRLAGGRVRTRYIQDPSLLGGAILKIGSTVYDGSLRAQLAALKEHMIAATLA